MAFLARAYAPLLTLPACKPQPENLHCVLKIKLWSNDAHKKRQNTCMPPPEPSEQPFVVAGKRRQISAINHCDMCWTIWRSESILKRREYYTVYTSCHCCGCVSCLEGIRGCSAHHFHVIVVISTCCYFSASDPGSLAVDGWRWHLMIFPLFRINIIIIRETSTWVQFYFGN